MNNIFTQYHVGQKITEMVGANAPAYYVGEDGIFIIHPLYLPTRREIECIKNGNKRFYLTHLNGVVALSIQFSNALICDYEINPYLIPEIHIPVFPEGTGLLITFLLVNSANGEVVLMKAMGLGTDFSKALLKALKEEQEQEGSAETFPLKALNFQRNYTPEQVIKYSQKHFSIPGK